MSAPLILRPGARYECHGDDTCCTAVHLIGPLSRTESQRIRRAKPHALPNSKLPVVEYHEGIHAEVIACVDGSCVFLDKDRGCLIHATVGPEQKSAACRRFPIGATQTPRGLRVNVSHRCSCVSMGHSALLTESSAVAALRAPKSSRILKDFEVGSTVKWARRCRVSFDDYAAWDRSILASLDREQDEPSISSILGVKRNALPKLRFYDWSDLSERLDKWVEDEPLDDGFACTLRWARLVLPPHSRKKAPLPQRPWAWTFDRGRARTPDPLPVRRVFGSWLADDLFGMSWVDWGSVHKQFLDMSARFVIASRLSERLLSIGLREDQAAAEAVMIVDTLGNSETWEWVRKHYDDTGPFGSVSA